MVNLTTTSTTSTTIMRSALDNDALRRVVAAAIRRARRGYKKSSEAPKNSWHYFSQLAASGVETAFILEPIAPTLPRVGRAKIHRHRCI
jgi:hypothetical protein